MSTARTLYFCCIALLVFAAFMAAFFLCGTPGHALLALLMFMVVAILGALCRERKPSERDEFWDSPLMYALGGLDYFLFRSLFVFMGDWAVLIQAPIFCGLVLLGARGAGMPPGIGLFVLELAFFALGFFWPPLSYILRVRLAELCNEEPPQSPEEIAKEHWEKRAEEIRAQTRERKREAENAQEERFVELMTPVLVAVAQADNHFSQDELQVMLTFFQDRLGWQGVRLNRIKMLIKTAMSTRRPLGELVAECGELGHSHRLMLMEVVYELVFTKEPPLATELRLAREIGSKLGLFTTDMRGIEAKYRFREQRQHTGNKQNADGAYRERVRSECREKARLEQREQCRNRHEETSRDEWQDAGSEPATIIEALAILGLKPGATSDMDAIKTAWRRMVSQYHPDKFAHLGPEFIRIAGEKTKSINAAYRLLTTHR